MNDLVNFEYLRSDTNDVAKREVEINDAIGSMIQMQRLDPNKKQHIAITISELRKLYWQFRGKEERLLASNDDNEY